MPPAPGMAFVIITHLAPDRPSLLTEILARQTSLQVEVAQDEQTVEKDKVYILPPNAILTIVRWRPAAGANGRRDHQRTPINVFFSSLAQDRGEYAVGIVLSGSGSDGVLGVKAIKECGGVTFAQAKDASGPGFCRHAGQRHRERPRRFCDSRRRHARRNWWRIWAVSTNSRRLCGRPARSRPTPLVEARETICAILFVRRGMISAATRPGLHAPRASPHAGPSMRTPRGLCRISARKSR